MNGYKELEMFVVKLKSKDATSPSYCNKHLIMPVNEMDQNRTWLTRKDFILSLKEAKELYKILLYRALDKTEIYEYVSIVELSNYEPHPEHQVIAYREFK